MNQRFGTAGILLTAGTPGVAPIIWRVARSGSRGTATGLPDESLSEGGGADGEDMAAPFRAAASLAWFKRRGVEVPVCGILLSPTQARSASEGSTFPRLRFGLVFLQLRGGHPDAAVEPAQLRLALGVDIVVDVEDLAAEIALLVEQLRQRLEALARLGRQAAGPARRDSPSRPGPASSFSTAGAISSMRLMTMASASSSCLRKM